MVLDKLPVPGRPTSLDDSRARAYCACSRCGWGLFGHFTLLYPFSPLSPSLWETARYRLKYCLKGPLNPKQQQQHSFKRCAKIENETTWLLPLKTRPYISSITTRNCNDRYLPLITNGELSSFLYLVTKWRLENVWQLI